MINYAYSFKSLTFEIFEDKYLSVGEDGRIWTRDVYLSI